MTHPKNTGARELLDCPFCGSASVEFVDKLCRSRDVEFIHVQCQGCGASSNGYNGPNDVPQKLWNTRTPTDREERLPDWVDVKACMADAAKVCRQHETILRLLAILKAAQFTYLGDKYVACLDPAEVTAAIKEYEEFK